MNQASRCSIAQLECSIAAYAMQASSRSHSVLMLTLERSFSRNSAVLLGLSLFSFTHRRTDYSIDQSSKLTLVDLAGSERQADTGPVILPRSALRGWLSSTVVSTSCRQVAGASGRTLQESASINQSLFVLRKVIAALAKQQNRQSQLALIPYRESKLTILLRDALGGSGYTLMLACLSVLDSSVEENLSTLQYACTAGRIRNRPLINLDPTSLLIKQLRQEIQGLKRQLETFQQYVVHVTGKPIPLQVLHEGMVPDAASIPSVAEANVGGWGTMCQPGAHPGENFIEQLDPLGNQSYCKPATPRGKVKAATPPLAVSRQPEMPHQFQPPEEPDPRINADTKGQADGASETQDETLGISKEELAERLSEAIATLRQATTENFALRRKCDAAQQETEALKLQVSSLEKELLLHSRRASHLGSDAWFDTKLDSLTQLTPEPDDDTMALAAMPGPETCAWV